MKLTSPFIIEARFIKAGDDESSKSLVNVFRRDLKVTSFVVNAGVVDVSAAVVDVGTAVIGKVAVGAAVVDEVDVGAAVVDEVNVGSAVAGTEDAGAEVVGATVVVIFASVTGLAVKYVFKNQVNTCLVLEVLNVKNFELNLI